MKRSTKLIGISGVLGLILILGVLFLIYRENILWTYKDPGKEFTIKYPASWKIDTNLEGAQGAKVRFKSPLDGPLDIFHENLNVVILDISQQPMDLKEFSEEAIKQMELIFLHNFILEESSSFATLSGQPAYKVIFTGKGPDTDYTYYMIWTVIDKDTAYQLTYTAIPSQFEKYFDRAQTMMESFEILR